jgi:Tfp pilus assembly protein PilO
VNRRLLIPLGIGVAIIILWFVALYGPQSSALSDARKRTDQATQEGATLRDQLTRLQQSRRDQPLKQSQLETLRVAVPDDPNLAQFILDANDAASRAGIDFLSITPTPPSAAGQPATTPTTAAGGAGVPVGAAATPVPIRIAMTATGGYFQVLDFVNRLNRLPRIVVVDSLNVAGQGGAAQLSVTMQERIFTTSSRPVGGGTTGGGGTTPGSSTTTTAPGGTTTTSRPGGG